MIGRAIRAVLDHREGRAEWHAGTHPRDPAIVKMLGLGNRSSAGIHVHRENANTVTAYWRGVNLISQGVAKLPLCTYRRVMKFGREGKEKAKEHPAYNLMRKRPCPSEWMTAFTFKETLTSHAIHHGNGYAAIFRNPNTGEPTDLVPLNPERTFPFRANGVLWYLTRIVVGGRQIERKLRPEDVLHIHGLGFDGLCGYPLVEIGRHVLGVGLAAQDFVGRFFANGAHTSGIFLVPGNFDDEAMDHLMGSFERAHVGIENAWKVALFEEGIKYEKTSVDPKEADMTGLQGFNIKQIANLLNMPPHKLGDAEKAAYNSLEQEQQGYLDETMDPWLIRWEEEADMKLLTEEEKTNDTTFFAFNRNALVRVNLEARSKAYGVFVDKRIMNPNDVRIREDMDPYEGGDEFFTVPGSKPVSGQTSQTDGDEEEDEPSDEKPKRSAAILAAARVTLLDCTTRAVKRIGVHARRATTSPKKFCDWLDAFRDEHAGVIADMLRPAVEIMRAISPPVTHDRYERLPGTILDQLHAVLNEVAGRATTADLAAAVDEAMADREANHAASLADTLNLPRPQ